MRGTVDNLVYKRDGGQQITITVSGDRQQVAQIVDKFVGKDCDIQIKVHRERRSLDANAYFHVLATAIAREVGSSMTDIKQKLVFDYGTVLRGNDNVPLCAMLPASAEPSQVYPYAMQYKSGYVGQTKVTYYLLYKPTHLMDTSEMAQLIDGTINQAKALGIQTMTPAQIEKIKKAWEKRQHE